MYIYIAYMVQCYVKFQSYFSLFMFNAQFWKSSQQKEQAFISVLTKLMAII